MESVPVRQEVKNILDIGNLEKNLDKTIDLFFSGVVGFVLNQAAPNFPCRFRGLGLMDAGQNKLTNENLQTDRFSESIAIFP